MADLVCTLYARNDDREESEVTERVGHGDTETPSFCWLGKRRSLCLSVSVAYLLCVLRPLRVSVPMNAIELVNVSKVYRRYVGRHFSTLKSALLQRSTLRDLQPSDTFPALTAVTFPEPQAATC